MKPSHTLGMITLVVCCLLALPAGAVPKPSRYPAMVGGLRTDQATSLVILEEQVRFTCFEDPEGERCRFEAIYRIQNPGDEDQQALAGFFTVHATEVVTTLDGREISTPLTPQQVVLLDGSISQEERDRFPDGFFASVPPHLQEQIGRYGIPLTLAPGQISELVVQGVVEPAESFRPAWVRSAVETRHLLLSTRSPDRIVDLDYLMASQHCWASVGPLQVTIRYPRSWLFTAGAIPDFQPYSEVVSIQVGDDWTSNEEGALQVVSTTVASGAGTRLAASFTRPASKFSFGGVLLGLGGAVDDSGGFRMRVGVEVAAPDWLLYSLNVDTDWSERFMITPTVVAATGSPSFLPIGFGVGLGMPIEILDDFRVGVRAQVDMVFGPLGFVTSFDLFPGLASGDRDRLQVVMLGQISL
ncbi:MAG: hypothetical protein JW797_14305 [Bradymonadales bacterium]|nr:hypothetical protein [Bradymonadales bacterium]